MKAPRFCPGTLLLGEEMAHQRVELDATAAGAAVDACEAPVWEIRFRV